MSQPHQCSEMEQVFVGILARWLEMNLQQLAREIMPFVKRLGPKPKRSDFLFQLLRQAFDVLEAEMKEKEEAAERSKEEQPPTASPQGRLPPVTTRPGEL